LLQAANGAQSPAAHDDPRLLHWATRVGVGAAGALRLAMQDELEPRPFVS